MLGRLAPGTAVSQQGCARSYGTSRMPVRDALLKLTSEGLIVTDQRGHSVVARLTAQDILDVFDIEAVVHGRAARRAAARVTSDDVERLQAAHEAMGQAETAGDLVLVTELNWRFHKQINVLADSAKLLAVIRSVSLNIPQTYLLELPDWAAKSNREHAGIIAALAAQDGAEAETLVNTHVREAGSHLAAYLAKKGLFEI